METIEPTSEVNPPGNTPDIFQPATTAGITRRSFIKRTTATVLVAVLALDAFMPEARAQEAGESSGSWYIELTGNPPALEIGDDKVLLDDSVTASSATWTPDMFKQIPNPIGLPGRSLTAPTLAFTVTLRAYYSPGGYRKTLCADGQKRYVYSAGSVMYWAVVEVFNGVTKIGGGTAVFHGAWAANLISGGPNLQMITTPTAGTTSETACAFSFPLSLTYTTPAVTYTIPLLPPITIPGSTYILPATIRMTVDAYLSMSKTDGGPSASATMDLELDVSEHWSNVDISGLPLNERENMVDGTVARPALGFSPLLPVAITSAATFSYSSFWLPVPPPQSPVQFPNNPWDPDAHPPGLPPIQEPPPLPPVNPFLPLAPWSPGTPWNPPTWPDP